MRQAVKGFSKRPDEVKWSRLQFPLFMFRFLLLTLGTLLWSASVHATTFTTTVPGTNITLPADYPEAGGVAFVLIGANGNIYYQFSNPAGAFRGFNSNGQPTEFRGNPFTINDPLVLDCGFSTCNDYFGGSIARVHIRFSAYDGDTQPRGFDENDISLILNGFNVGSWSGMTTEITDTSGTQSFGFTTGFGNNTFNTGWFSSTNPALLGNILSTGQTTTQVLDDDPNDNYWDFRRGSNLSNSDIVTVAPGYELEKTADKTDFTTAGETITYTYVVTNIGSVPIRNLSVDDDVIGAINSCDKTTILDTNPGGTADFATCVATYQVTQADMDRGFVTNTAAVDGTPDFGVLGTLSDAVTVNGPAENPVLFVEKSTTLSQFGAAGSSVPYSILIRNDGNVTLSNFSVSDPLLPGMRCNVPDLAPGADFTCSGSYSVQQSDVDAFANAGTTLDNTVTVDAESPAGTDVQGTDSVSLDGPAAAPALDLTKTAQNASFDAVGDVLTYQIRIENTGNVTYPVPVVNDALTGGATCPGGNIAPGNAVICTASYTVQQPDIDNGAVPNTASASVTVGGVTASDSDDATVPAVRTTGLTLDKRLQAASPTSFVTTGIGLSYEYVLTNTGNVTLETPQVSDDKVAVTCAAATIAPGTSITCTSSAPYATVQADLDAGGVTNIASATATAAGPTPEAVSSNSDSVTVPAVQQPELTLSKTAPVLTAAQYVAGQVVTYDYAVENTGNIEISTATVGASEISITDDKIGTFTCAATPLAVGGSVTCTADYTLTNADIQAGTVVNTATATGGSVVSDQVTAQIAPTFTPAITLAKSAVTASVSATTDTIDYTFEVTNSGDTTLFLPDNQISIADPALSAAADCSAQPSPFAPGASFICTGQRVGVSQSELDAGQVDNTADASFDFTNGGTTITITSNQSSTSVPVTAAPSMIFSKTGPAQFDAVNQTITYTFSVENDGNVTMNQVTVTDPLIPGLSCTLIDIAPGATDSCTGSYQVTQANMDAEVINNSATATAIPAQGAQFQETASAAVPVNPAVPVKAATLDKQASPAGFAAVGEQITYTMVVENTGTQTLGNMTVTDILDPGFSCAISTLAPGDTSSVCTFTYTVTQDDIDAGQVDNTASLSSAEFATQSDSETVTGPTRSASYTFDKAVSGGFTTAGQTLTYTFRVENTGNVSLSNIVITDPFFGSPINCTIPSLAPGAIDNTTCSASYVVQQPDVDAGSISNTASVTVDAPAGVGDPADQSDTVVSNGPAENAAVQIVKASTDGAYASAVDSEDYTFTVTNTGNVTLTNLTVSDSALGFSCALDDLAPGGSTTLCAAIPPLPGTPLGATKNFDQGDVDAGSFTNTATVTGQSAGLSTPVSDQDEVTVTGPAQAPALTMTKSSTYTGAMDAVGQVLTYDYVVTNSGNITITSDISVSDEKIATVTCPATPAAGIAPGASITCTGEYEVTLADLDAGQVVNNAIASVTQPVIPQNPGDDPFATVQSNQATETVTATQLPALRLDKRVKSTSAASFGLPGDVVTFEYVVTNTGNVTTTAPITVSDDKIAGSLTCTAAAVAPGDSVTCEQDWVAAQPDVDAGEVTNNATADTIFDGAPVQSNTDSVTINAVQTPALSVEKTFVSTDNPGAFDAGDTLTYSIVVSNTGNVTIDAPITLTDNLTTPSCPAVPGGELAPGGALTCSSTHVVTANDLLLGAATNVVYATGVFDGAPVQSPSDDAIYPVNASPALSLTKTAQATNVPFDALNQVITYDYTVVNTGNVGLAGDIVIVDDVIGNVACKSSATLPLATGASHTCQATYTITQDDLDRGFVTNNATAQTTFPPGGASPTQVVSPNAAETVAAVEDPELTVSKSQIRGIVAPELNDDLTYRIVAENTGNQTIAGVSIADALLPSLTCLVFDTGNVSSPAPANVVLLPGERLQCEGDYTVTQSDVDAQTLVNTASATGTDPQGVTISDDDTHTQALVAPVVDMTVTKVILPDPGAGQAFTDPGQELTFVISVENTGNITLNTATITDDRTVTPTSCGVGPIEPGEVDDSCVFTYTVTQADMDVDNGAPGSEFGGFTNTASVTAVPNNGTLSPITETDDVFVRGPLQEPRISLVKESTTTEISTYNQRVEYTYTIANTGNVTLFEAPVITDDKIGTFTCAGIPGTGLAPSDFYQCTAEYFVTQADLDAGFVTNTALASSNELPDDASDSLTIDGVRTPGLAITKTASPTTGVAVGDVISYTYEVQNNGNVTLSGVTLLDQHSTAAGTAPLVMTSESVTSDVNETGTSLDSDGPGVWSTLGAGDTVTFEASYTVTQDDIDAQAPITNDATVTATSPDGSTPEADDQASVALLTKAPGIAIAKIADDSAVTTPAQVGQTVTFTIEVANTGNQTLDNVVLSDTFTDADGNAITLSTPLALISGDGDTDGELDVGETWTYRATFDLTQAAIDAGGLENTASVTANDPQGVELSDALAAPVEVPLPQDTGIDIAKSADVSAVSDPAVVGQTVSYEITVANTGNTTLTDMVLTDSFTDGNGAALPITPTLTSGDSDTDNELDVGETWTYTASFDLTQGAIDSGLISNTASVEAQDPDNAAVSDALDAPVEVALPQETGIEIAKSSDASGVSDPAVVGQTVSYEITVANTGNTTLSDVILTDSFTDGAGAALPITPALTSGDTDGDGVLDVGETWTYQASFDLTQEVIDSGAMSNTASVDAKDPDDNDVSDTIDAPVDLDLGQDPAMTLVKSATVNDGGDGRVEAGDTITYRYEIENTGNVTLYDLGVTETGFAGLGAVPVPALSSGGADLDGEGDAADLAVGGGTVVFEATYTLTQEDVDAGEVTNQATAQATPPIGVAISDLSGSAAGNDDPTTTPLTREPGLQVLKTALANLSTPPAVGDPIYYTIRVENTGNVTLDAPVLSDQITTAQGGTETLVAAPAYDNGDLNGGGALDVGEIWTYAAEYRLTQAAIDAGGVSNTVDATAQGPDGLSATDTSDDGVGAPDGNDPTVTDIDQNPAIATVKSAALDLGADGVATVGDVVTYTYAVTNEGNVSLLDVVVAETGFGGAGTTPVPTLITGGAAIGGSAAADLPVGGTMVFEASYALTQADIDAGEVSNQATAQADTQTGPSVSDPSGSATDNDTPTDLAIPEAPGLDVVKTAILTGLGSPVVAGDSISFVIIAENTGNVTLENVALSDTFTRRDGTVLSLLPILASGDGGVAGELEVGETWEYRATYTLTQEDIDAGGVQNQAVVDATTEQGTNVSDTSDNGDDGDGNSEDDPTLVTVGGNPAFTLAKREATGSPNPFDAVDQVISYAFDITNTGNITITAPIVIDDPLISGQGAIPVTCPAPPIAPGQTVTCTGGYRVEQADLDAGQIVNTATASITQPLVPEQPGDPTEIVVSEGPETVTVPADQQPGMSLAKALSASSPTSYTAAGDTLSYDYTVTNTGNVTLAGPITVDDDLIGAGLACAAGPLAPGASVTCTHSYTVNQDDLNAGDVTNIASADANFGGIPVETDEASVTVPAIQTPELSFAKELLSATPDLFDEGTALAYEFTLTNSGNVTIAGPFAIDDPLLDSVSCPVPTGNVLQPGEELVCTGAHELTAANIALGSLVNVASVSGTFDGDPVTSPSDDAIYPVDAVPSLTLTKDSVPSDVTYAAVGDEITYSYTITNNSTVGFTEDVVVNDDKITDPILCHDASEAGVLNVGETATCSAVYTVTQTDLDAGSVTNEAIGATVFAPGTENEQDILSPAVTKTVPADAMPALELAKEITDAPSEAALGDVIEFTLTATNTGNQTIAGVTITDPLITALSCTVDAVAAPANVVLAPTQALVCVGTYEVLQGDIDAQGLSNSASVSGADPLGEPITDETSVTVPLVGSQPVLSVVKSIDPEPAAGQPAFVNPGDSVNFRITVTNDGNVTLQDVAISDALPVTPGSCSVDSLAPGQSDASCVVAYTVSQADIDGYGSDAFGGFDNTASATATAATPGSEEATGEDTIFVRGPDHAPELTLEKTADAAAVAAAGDTINYTYLVTNSGNITLTQAISVSDDRIANVNCPTLPAGGLAPGGQITCTASDTATQDDIDTGHVTNVAAAASSEAEAPATPGGETDTVVVPVTADPGLSLVKTASETGEVSVGTEITYTYTVTNIGNQSLADISVSDQHVSAAGLVALNVAGEALATDAAPAGDSSDAAQDGAWDDLKPGDVVTFTATYTVTQDDVDQQVALENSATANATAPGDVAVDGTDALSVSVETSTPELTATKVVDGGALSSPPAPGDVVSFDITVTNSGNQTLDGISLIDTLLRTDGTPVSIAPPVLTGGDAGTAGEMAPGEVWTYTASHTLTQADIDAGGISNQVQARGLSPDDTLVTDMSDDNNPANGDNNPAVLQIPAMPGIEGEKTVLAAASAVGDTVVFQITATNTGNVTLGDVAVASDTLERLDGTALTLTSAPIFIGADQGSGAGTLLPGETASYTVTYVLVQEDIDAGGVTNSARVTGAPPVGSPVTDVTDNGDDGDGNSVDDRTEMVIPPQPSIGLTKRLADTAPAAYAAVGTEIPYEFLVENTGNITLRDAVTVSDPLITDAGGIIDCPALPAEGLAPGQTIICQGSYLATQADIDAGAINNTATATLGDLSTDSSSTSIPALPLPALSMAKTAEDLPAAEFVTGRVVTYTFTTTNTGNTTVVDPITVNDTLIPAADITCPDFPAQGLAPGADYVCTGAYTVTADDVDLGSVINLASASDGETDSLINSATVPNEGTPSLTVEKVATEADFDAVGDVLNFTFNVTNSGERAFARVVNVTDTLIGEVTCFTPSGSDPDFSAGEVVSCAASYTVTQEDLDRGFVINEAYASTVYGGEDTQVFSEPDAVNVPAATNPELSIVKSAATLPVSGVGQVLTYTVSVTNSGNQTLTSVSASDAMLNGFTCEAASLAPGAEMSCSGTYEVQQADVDAGSIVNTAEVEAVSPQGARVEAETSLEVDMPTAAPAVALAKEATPTPFGPVGSTLTYLFTVENTGNVTLSNLVIADVMDPGYGCEIASLAPGASNQSCAMAVAVTQEMVDAGVVDNTASVAGSDPNGTEATGRASLSTAGPERAPMIEATKVAMPAPGTVGAVVPFILTVENLGNVTLDNVVITDVMTDGNGTPIALDAPFALVASSDVGGDGLLGVGERWIYRAELTLTQGMVNSGGVGNQATATASDPAGTVVSDLSDNGNDTDGNTTDDITLVTIAAEPGLHVVKSVETPGSNVGDEVVFLITATNVGNVALTDLTAGDSLTRLTGDPLEVMVGARDVPEPLDSGASATWEVRHVLTQADIDAGGLSNTASVTGTTPGDEQVTDISANDDPTDGNNEDDPTIMTIAPEPGMEVIKTMVEAGTLAGESVSYRITVENTGNMTLTGIALSDALTDLDGQNARTPAITFVSSDGDPASPEGSLAPGETATYNSVVTIEQSDIEAGGLSNSVTATAATLLGGSLQDVSDDDGDGGDDPTIVQIVSAPALDVVKSVTDVAILFPTVEQVTFAIEVTNTGNVIQTGLQLHDDLAAFIAPAILLNETYPPQLQVSGFADGSANPGYDGVGDTATLSGNPTLAPGETGRVEVVVTYSSAAGAPGGENVGAATSDQHPDEATGRIGVSVTDADGDGIPDMLESGSEDRDGDGIPDNQDYDPTGYFYCEDTGIILSGGQVTVSGGGFTQTGVGSSGPITIIQDGSSGYFQFFVTAPGTYDLTYTNPTVGVPSATRTSLGTLDATTLLPANPAAIGSGEAGATGYLADSSAGANPFYTQFVFEAGDPFVINNNLPMTQCAAAPQVLATKTVDRVSAVFGETVNYTLSFRNDSSVTYTGAQIIDRLPAGLVYTPNSARVDGAPIEPVIAGGTMAWTVNMVPTQTITVTFSARVRRNGEFGVRTNRTWLQDPTGTRVSNVARADVRIEPEHVFDCSDVIGKVFDDKNGNGYQDGPGTLARPITDQDYAAGKIAAAPVTEPGNATEPGIAGVRLATPDGVLITTDEHGRFSVPCAALPRAIGSNFQLKLDTRTLPTGYRVTTENPRNIRLTAGKMAKMNFGARLGHVVRIDLNASAFVSGQAAPGAALDGALDGLLTRISGTPSVLRLTYVLGRNEAPQTARARLKELERLLRKRWRGKGNYKLIIERTVTRGGE